MNINEIRNDFPLLRDNTVKKPPIYFDNACQSLRPQSVINAIVEYYEKYPVCASRSNHKLGEIVTRKIVEARETAANFIGAKRKEEIIFTRNTTEGINLVAHSLGLKNGDVVLTTDKEHNSNLIPWQILAEEKGIVHKIVHSKEDNTFDLEKFKENMNSQVKLVSMVYTSNLDGVILPVKEVAQIAHRYGAKILLDAAQTMSHQKINVAELDVDFLSFSGHKILGPSGTGVLYGKYNILEEMAPFLTGGETVKSSTYATHELLPVPEKFEAGLQDYAGIIGMAEAIKYIGNIGFEFIAKQEYEINKFITEETEKMPAFKIIGPKNPALRGSIISFYSEKIDSHQISLILDETNNIMVRSGQHCVHSWFNARSIKNSARVSLSFYNTMDEAKIFISALNKINKLL
ncbi:MAG: cysteine desulfurase [bacterium]|nr:cysteine desulfurase [bacterium]